MPLSIRNAKAEELARQAAERAQKNITQVIIEALEDYVRRLHVKEHSHALADEIMDISRRCCTLPDQDERSVLTIINDSESGEFS